MTDKLPPNLLALFAPRPPLRWVPPSDYPAEERKTANPSGVANFLDALKEYKDNDNYVPTESWLQARDRKKQEKQAALERLLSEVPKSCETALSCLYSSSCTWTRLTMPQTSLMKIPTFAVMHSRL